VLSGRYEVLGCLAHGWLGWIYLARDTHVSDKVADRWVVLKGLIDTGDPDAMAAAVNERRFLVNVDHRRSSRSTTSRAIPTRAPAPTSATS
jgi:serine/threonine-protein kinase PknG